jgi:hypothetical protein
MRDTKYLNPSDGANLFERRIIDDTRVATVESPSFEVHGLDPNKPRKLILIYPELNLGAAITLTGDEKAPLTVQLKCAGSVTGKVLDISGKPIQEGRIIPVYSDPLSSEMMSEVWRRGLTPWVDGTNGNFHIEAVVPGMPFSLFVYNTQSTLAKEDAPRLFQPPKAGETVDLGRVR